jgi:hypothetical protein
MLTYHGSPYYLARQARRLGISQRIADACRHDKELFSISTMLGQLYGHLIAAEKAARFRTNDNPVGSMPRPESIRESLENAEVHVAKLHLAAAAADEALAEAWTAFGQERPRRPYEIMANSDVQAPAADVALLPAEEFIAPDPAALSA